MPTPTYTPLATVTLGGTASSVTFSSIPATYRDLICVVNAGCNGSNITARLNGDSGSNYSYVYMFGNGSTATSAAGTLTQMQGAGMANSLTQMSIFSLFDYSATDKHKTAFFRDSVPSLSVSVWANRWANTAAVTSIVFGTTNNPYIAGSTFSLYGVIA
jgi:hypothetical protein